MIKPAYKIKCITTLMALTDLVLKWRLKEILIVLREFAKIRRLNSCRAVKSNMVEITFI